MVDSFTEKGNFSDTTFYLIAEDPQMHDVRPLLLARVQFEFMKHWPGDAS